MQHRIAALRRGAHPVRIADVAGEHFEFAGDVRAAAVEPAAGIERVVEHERPHLVAGAHQRLGEMRADEAIGARDQHLHHRRPGHAAKARARLQQLIISALRHHAPMLELHDGVAAAHGGRADAR